MAAVEGPIAGFAWVLVPDVVSHELDVRNALGRKDGRDTPELGAGARGHGDGLR